MKRIKASPAVKRTKVFKLGHKGTVNVWKNETSNTQMNAEWKPAQGKGKGSRGG